MQHRAISPADAASAPAGSLWKATAASGPNLPSLSGDIEADVLVIGGGIAGTSLALHLAERGVDAVLIEAGEPGDGATGQSGGLVAPDYIRHSPETIRAVLGQDAGERLTRMIGNSAGAVFDLIARHSIDCDARQDGFYTPAHTQALAEKQRQYANQWRSRGFDVDFVERGDAGRLFGLDRYCGALRFGRGGSLNPLAYVRGLARAAEGAGARLFANSPVSALERHGSRWIGKTPAGSVSARHVVLAANGGNAALHPAMRRTSLPLHVFQFATAPLTSAQRRVILPEGGAFTDKLPYLFTARIDGQGHLVSAFAMTMFVHGEEARYREARRRLRQHFDVITDPQIDYLWRGLAWVNTSFLPEIYDLGDDAIAIQACNGRGIAINTMLGMEVAAMLATGDRDALSVRPRSPKPVRFHSVTSLLPRLLMSMAYLMN